MLAIIKNSSNQPQKINLHTGESITLDINDSVVISVDENLVDYYSVLRTKGFSFLIKKEYIIVKKNKVEEIKKDGQIEKIEVEQTIRTKPSVKKEKSKVDNIVEEGKGVVEHLSTQTEPGEEK